MGWACGRQASKYEIRWLFHCDLPSVNIYRSFLHRRLFHVLPGVHVPGAGELEIEDRDRRQMELETVSALPGFTLPCFPEWKTIPTLFRTTVSSGRKNPLPSVTLCGVRRHSGLTAGWKGEEG